MGCGAERVGEEGDVAVVTQKSRSKNSPQEGWTQQPGFENLQLCFNLFHNSLVLRNG